MAREGPYEWLQQDPFLEEIRMGRRSRNWTPLLGDLHDQRRKRLVKLGYGLSCQAAGYFYLCPDGTTTITEEEAFSRLDNLDRLEAEHTPKESTP